MQVHLGDTPHSLTESDFESLARRTDGFSGSDIAVCVSNCELLHLSVLCFTTTKSHLSVLCNGI